jgi:antirestriction protein ArdC
VYQEVTDRIIAELERGAIPWTKPWKARPQNGGFLPHNVVTGRAYHGINVPILWCQADMLGYPTHSWLTFKQAKEKGGSIRKGEKATQVVFTKKLRIKDELTEEDKQISMVRGYFVFNAAQVDGLPDPPATAEVPPEARHSAAESFIAATHANIRYGGNEACFVPSLDYIEMPPFSAFKTAEGFYCTELHECTHWSGHESRLDRNLTGRFGTRSYAAEELVAELGAAFLCAHLSIEGELRHAGYIAEWIELFRHDERAIFTAAAKAQQAADYLRSFSGPEGVAHE